MYHKISQMCDKIDVIKQKSDSLRWMKYKTSGPDVDWERQVCDELVADIQAMCREVASDNGEYQRWEEATPISKTITP